MYDRILGGLIGAGAGDAMGAATEARTTEQILSLIHIFMGHLPGAKMLMKQYIMLSY